MILIAVLCSTQLLSVISLLRNERFNFKSPFLTNRKFSTQKYLTPGSAGVEIAIEYLNSESSSSLMNKLALNHPPLLEESQKENFWTGGNFLIKKTTCQGNKLINIVIPH
jgi:hypothetical protein